MTAPLGPRVSVGATPDSGTKFPSTCDAPVAVFRKVGSLEKTLSSSTRPHVVQHLRAKEKRDDTMVRGRRRKEGEERHRGGEFFAKRRVRTKEVRRGRGKGKESRDRPAGDGSLFAIASSPLPA